MNHINLSGSWKLETKENKSIRTSQISIPGDIYSALYEGGDLPDPYKGRNELKCQWPAKIQWTISREFQTTAELLESEEVYLKLVLLDTYTEVFLNNTLVKKTDNMFREYILPVKDRLKSGTNTLAITFLPPEKEAEKLAQQLPYPVPFMPYPVQGEYRNLMRKAQCHAGWDWGPCLLTSGLYSEPLLIPSQSGRIEYFHVIPRKSGNKWYTECQISYNSLCEGEIGFQYKWDDSRESESFHFTVNKGPNLLNFKTEEREAELWWPNGYGGQKLYGLSLSGPEEILTKKIGFRELEVLSDEDEKGKGLTFRVNGLPIFAKGANWIPMDALPGRYSEERYRDLLQSAADVNMNTLRIWGGGHYELDTFYDLCDELGLLIWHDFMFSCALYPSEKGFLSTVREEVRFQVNRLKDRTSLMLWCGNNENVGALTWFEESRKFRDRYIIDYDRLNEGVIGETVRELDTEHIFWPSSPSGGPGDFSDNWHDDSRGDMHYWSVWHEGKPFDAYYDVIPRFCSEFGFQSFPSLNTVKTYADEDQWNMTSPVMRHHQKNENGNTIILETMSRYFRFPEGFENMLYISQVQQALAIKTAVEFWRSRRPLCQGAIYWQLNDNWPVASWASLEYGGQWKLLHFEAARFFAPLRLSLYKYRNQLEIYGLNDSAEALKSELVMKICRFDGTCVEESRIPVSVPAGESARLYHSPLNQKSDWRENHFLTASLLQEDTIISEDCFFYEYPRDCSLEKTVISIEKCGEGKLTLKTDKPAFYVYLTSEEQGRFSDNGFHLMPGEPKTVQFSGSLDSVRATHLRETYS